MRQELIIKAAKEEQDADCADRGKDAKTIYTIKG
jgi:hypothetical protein